MTVNAPTREYLSFDELKARWQWSDADLYHAVASGVLAPVVWVGPDVGAVEWQRFPMGMFPFPIDEAGEVSHQDQDRHWIEPQWAYLRTADGGPATDITFRAAALNRDADIFDGAGFPDWVGLDESMPMMDIKTRAYFLLSDVEAYEVKSINTPAQRRQVADYSKLATREQLIAAFGSFTGMDMTWFDNITDTPALHGARKIEGKGGRHPVEPMFCPLEVMQWLISGKRKKGGRRLSEHKGWELLESYFPRVYAAHSVGDPREPS